MIYLNKVRSWGRILDLPEKGPVEGQNTRTTQKKVGFWGRILDLPEKVRFRGRILKLPEKGPV